MMLHIMLMFAAVGACLHAALGWLLAMNPLLPMPTEMYKCAVGLSGVLFGLIVVDTHASGSHPRSVLGLFKVRAVWYPWVLLLLLQLLMPSVSFVGHVSGLLTGLAFVHNMLPWLTLAPRTVSYVEAHWARRMPSVTESSTFVQHQEGKSSLPFVAPHTSAASAPPHSVLPWARGDAASSASSSSSSSGGLTGQFSRLFGAARWGGGGQSRAAFTGKGRTLGGGGGGGGEGAAAAVGGATYAALPTKATAAGSTSSGHVLRGGQYLPASVTLGGGGSSSSSSAAAAAAAPSKPAADKGKGKEKARVSAESVAALVEMGFDEAVAIKALEATNDDVALAIEVLT